MVREYKSKKNSQINDLIPSITISKMSEADTSPELLQKIWKRRRYKQQPKRNTSRGSSNTTMAYVNEMNDMFALW